MRLIGDLFSIFYWKAVVKWRSLKEERKVKKLYYSDSNFARCDRALIKAYRSINPYRVAKEFLKKSGAKETDLYGETYLTALDQIAKVCHLSEQDQVVELGCGRGRNAFFLANRYGCKVKGIDWVPYFIEQAQKIAQQCSCSRVSFSCENMHQADLSSATVVYLYGTCLKEEEIIQLAHSFKKLPKGAKIITVSYPLSDYVSGYVLIEKLTENFPWGKGDIFLQKVEIPSSEQPFNFRLK